MIRLQTAPITAALLVDALFGEPPETMHPTVLMGRAISAFEGRVLSLKDPRRIRLAGLFLTLSLPTLSFGLTCILSRVS